MIYRHSTQYVEAMMIYMYWTLFWIIISFVFGFGFCFGALYLPSQENLEIFSFEVVHLGIKINELLYNNRRSTWG